MSEQNNPYGETTGHVWDDNLAELTNQPPKWWMLGLHASWIFVLLYGIIYPSWPTLTGHTKGVIGWTQIGEYKQDLKSIEQVRAVYEDQLPGKSADDILNNEELTTYVQRSAKVLFGDNCAGCHGSGGAGNLSYPILVDDDWIYGGTIDNIELSIKNGRGGVMPKMGGAQLTSSEIGELADAIVSGNPTSSPLFMTKGCIACHGLKGKGNQFLGGVNLTDSVWRFAEADQRASIVRTISHGVNDTADPETRAAIMPKFSGGKLSDAEITKLAVYVKKLGG